MNRVEIKCPCCNKRLYITVEDANIVDAVETACENVGKKSLKEQEDRKKKFIAKYGEEAWNEAMAQCDEIITGVLK